MRRVKRMPLAVMLIALAGCAAQPLSTRERSTLGGAALGAGTGAIIGSMTGHAGPGAAIGGGIGALGGALIGNEMQNQERRDYETRAEIAAHEREIRRQRAEIAEIRRREGYDDDDRYDPYDRYGNDDRYDPYYDDRY